jgi:hypothetical protein
MYLSRLSAALSLSLCLSPSSLLTTTRSWSVWGFAALLSLALTPDLEFERI